VFARLGPKRLGIIGGALVVIIAVVAVVMSAGGSPKKPASTGGSTTSSSSTSSSAPTLSSNVCPLTDTPAPGGVVPKRPALAIKIGNEPPGDGNARPQSGLNEADIVYDTPAEGFIMRYEAIYQCNQASQVGPLRSVRWVDWHILAMYRNLPLLVHAGGINPDLDQLDAAKYVKDVNLIGNSPEASGNFPNLGIRTTNRVPPDNLYVSTSSVWAQFKNEKKPPTPVFTYSSSIPSSAKTIASAQINFSSGTDGVWTWSSADNLWLHSYAGQGADIDVLTGKQVSTNNVIVQIVPYKLGAYAESPGGSGDIESVMTGTGKGYLLRNGKEIPVTWHRANLSDTTTFTDAQGSAVTLTPGRTFVEIMTNTQADEAGAITLTK
jgi:hypothetical protein